MYEVWGKDIPEENQMFVDIWEFRKKFYKAENNDVYFDAARKAAEQILAKYPDQQELCRDQLWAVMRDFERKAGVMP